jgi:hypothetical protein
MKMQKAFSTAMLLSALLTAPATAQGPAPQNVRLTFQLIEADGFEGMDPAIADVVEELRDVFRFRGYRLLDTSVLRGTLQSDPDFTQVRQRLVFQEQGTFDIQAFIHRTESPTSFRISVSLFDGASDTVMDASVTVRSGQTVVLGSARPVGMAAALILVMTAQLDGAPGD